MRRAAAVLAALLAPASAAALEPRFDHRGQAGLTLELGFGVDTVSVPGASSRSVTGPSLRVAYGWDLVGEGNELVAGVRAAWPRPDPDDAHVRAALDLRYRAYFGSEELKTYLDVGVQAPVASRLALGPLVGLGVQVDPGRGGGLFAGAVLATGFGEARTTTYAVVVGAQVRF